MYQARLAYHHFPGACAGQLDIGRMLDERIMSDHWVRSLALLQVCMLIHRYACWSSLDSAHLSLFLLCSGSSGTVIDAIGVSIPVSSFPSLESRCSAGD